jgi:hypothetical protein
MAVSPHPAQLQNALNATHAATHAGPLCLASAVGGLSWKTHFPSGGSGWMASFTRTYRGQILHHQGEGVKVQAGAVQNRVAFAGAAGYCISQPVTTQNQ